LKEPPKGRKIDFQRLGSEGFELINAGVCTCSKTGDKTEFAHIPESQLSLLSLEREDKMCMPVHFPVPVREEKHPCHFQMEEKRVIPLAAEKNHFSPAADIMYFLSSESVDPVHPILPQNRKINDFDRADFKPCELGSKVPDYGLDFRKLGHLSILIQGLGLCHGISPN
jgi:hypothetical protein